MDVFFGGGQPIKSAKTRSNIDVFAKRANSLYDIDEKSKIRKSHENQYLKETYKEYLGNPGGDIAHKLLHTTYKPRKLYNIEIV